MNLLDATEARNETRQPQIKLTSPRAGRVIAVLPWLGREIIVEGNSQNHAVDVKFTAADIAKRNLCLTLFILATTGH